MVRNAEKRAAMAGRDAGGNLIDPRTSAPVSMSEADRVAVALDAVTARATPPDACSDDVPVSPARGPMVVHRPVVAVLTDNGPRVIREPLPHGAAARVASPLDLLEKASRCKSGGALFTPAQHIAAANYAALFELVNGGMVKCSSLEAQVGGGGAGSFMDAAVDNIFRLRKMDAAIGAEPVLTPRGAMAQPGRRTIRSDILVRWVLVKQEPLRALLAGHGWALQSRYLATTKAGLARALDRLYGV